MSLEILKELQEKKIQLIDEHKILGEKERTLKERVLILKKKLSVRQSEERINTKLRAIVNKVVKTDRLEDEMKEKASLFDGQKPQTDPRVQLPQLTKNTATPGRKLKLVKLKENVVFSWNYQELP